MYKQLLRFPGLRLLPGSGAGPPSVWVDWAALDRPLYLAVAQALLQYSKAVLSARSMARS